MRLVAPAFLAILLALPAAAAPKPAAKPAAKPAPAKPAPAKPASFDPTLISEGKEAILVDFLKPGGATIVLFYNPEDMDQKDLADTLGKRVAQDRKVGIRWVRVKSVDTPIAKQYQVTELPVGFVYDRNKNLVGQAATFTTIGPLVGRALRNARLKWVDEADPKAAEVYKIFGGGQRPVAEIMKTLSLNPGVLELVAQLSRYHFSDGYLPRKTHEMIASYVSAINKCKY